MSGEVIAFDCETGRPPFQNVVRGACELLGLDTLYVANEGRFVVFVPESDADYALEILRSQTVSAGPRQMAANLAR